jgi:hypothetical protein
MARAIAPYYTAQQWRTGASMARRRIAVAYRNYVSDAVRWRCVSGPICQLRSRKDRNLTDTRVRAEHGVHAATAARELHGYLANRGRSVQHRKRLGV